MPTIRVLEKSVAELIAAGEVVERPASVAKELIENSIDAGASEISVEISGGGVRMLRVSDNGCGISREDIPKAFLRHATSKVRIADDLDSIMTLGFRGEALASVAAMCRVELTTKTAEETEGTSYIIEGGTSLGIVPAGRPNGTTITVRDIFYNTPARMKFLKKDVTEGNSVAQVVDKCALSHPEISFSFTRDGAGKLKTSGNGGLLPVIYEIYGREFASELISVNYEYEDFAKVTGYISKPSASKPSRAYQTFFINNRFVKTRTAGAALEEAYKSKIMSGKFPACVLNIKLDAGSIDVNVHPAKTEVRFVNEKPVFSAVYYAVKGVLATLETPFVSVNKHEKQASFTDTSGSIEPQRISSVDFRESFAEAGYKPKKSVFAYENEQRPQFTRTVKMNAPSLDISVDDEQFSVFLNAEYKDNGKIFDKNGVNKAKNDTNYMERTEKNAVIEKKHDIKTPSYLRVIGEALGVYILLEENDGLILVDKHAAHERIIYEKLISEPRNGGGQTLLSPINVVLSHDEYTAVTENTAELEKLGFIVEDFGGNSVVVRAVPVELQKDDVAFILREIADKLKNNLSDLTPNALHKLYYSIACRAALKAGDKTSREELIQIVRQLKENPSITHCPHGRPVFIKLSRREIEKMFGRLG